MVLHDPIVNASAVALLCAILIGAALHKALDWMAFRETLRSYRIVPDAAVGFMALIVIAIEFSVVALLVLPGTRSLGAGATSLLLLMYSAAIAINLARGRTEIDCGCSWGGSGHGISAWLLLRNAALLPFAWLAGTLENPRMLGLGEIGLVAAAATCFFVLYQAADRLIANAPGLRSLRRSG